MPPLEPPRDAAPERFAVLAPTDPDWRLPALPAARCDALGLPARFDAPVPARFDAPWPPRLEVPAPGRSPMRCDDAMRSDAPGCRPRDTSPARDCDFQLPCPLLRISFERPRSMFVEIGRASCRE